MKEIYVNQEILTCKATDRFAAQHAVNAVISRREYLINGQWTTNTPSARPEGSRIVFDSVSSLRQAKDMYGAWRDISAMKAFTPEFPNVIMQRLANARKAQEPVTCFVPWGVRPERSFGEPEMIVLRQMQTLQETLENRKIPTQIMIMPADLYATEVNNQVGNEQAAAYFDKVTQTARDAFGFSVAPWSQIREENWNAYQTRAAELTINELHTILTAHKIREAKQAAERRSGHNTREAIEKAAYAYLRERICEAEIVEAIYAPVKVSAVPKNKDNEVDRDLPRLYIVPAEQQFPWLK